MIRHFALGLLLALALPTLPAPAVTRHPTAPPVRVRLDTSAGPIVITLEMKHAPITAGNFLRYVVEKRLDNTSFYRAARSEGDPRYGLVQGGLDHNMPRTLPPIKHEPTSVTGLRHVDGTVSMARNAPGTAMGDFFIVIGPAPFLDASKDDPGYAAFGHVVSGMAVARKILAMPTWPGGWSSETKGQSLRNPVKIITARRIP